MTKQQQWGRGGVQIIVRTNLLRSLSHLHIEVRAVQAEAPSDSQLYSVHPHANEESEAEKERERTTHLQDVKAGGWVSRVYGHPSRTASTISTKRTAEKIEHRRVLLQSGEKVYDPVFREGGGRRGHGEIANERLERGIGRVLKRGEDLQQISQANRYLEIAMYWRESILKR
jgi:hypothetical protein